MIYRLESLLLLLLLGLLWGAQCPLDKYALTHGVSTLGYAFWQMAGPALLFSGVLLFGLKFSRTAPSDPSPRVKILTRSRLKIYLISAVLAIIIPMITIYFVLPHLPASLSSLIMNMAGVLIYPLALLLKRERFDWIRASALLAGVVGLLCLMAIPETFPLGWGALALITPCCYALFVIYIEQVQRKYPLTNAEIAAGMLIGAAVLLSPIVIATHHFYQLHLPLQLVDGIILLEIVISTLGYLIFFKLLRTAGPVYYTLVNGVIALIGLIFSMIFLHEHLTPTTLAGATLILLGIFGINVRQRQPIAT